LRIVTIRDPARLKSRSSIGSGDLGPPPESKRERQNRAIADGDPRRQRAWRAAASRFDGDGGTAVIAAGVFAPSLEQIAPPRWSVGEANPAFHR
jgi:hypothetical protein